MPNITISIDEKLLKSGRQYADKHHTSVNALIRSLLEQTVQADSTQWVEECFSLMDRAKARSRGKRWKREELYDVYGLKRWWCRPRLSKKLSIVRS